MALQPGTRIGRCEIASLLGAGGMGEVYRARDTRLGRDVAIKILPPGLASDPERLARFEREAKALAAFNHPHIAQIYGLEESGDLRALIMELVEGPTLAELIGHSGSPPLDPPEAIRIARQIALALETAHQRGITHRDLKPSNIKVASDGAVKVLDFGLAKLSSTADSSLQQSAVDLSASPTLTTPALATGVGVILGTAPYMSPEQARGKPVDKRADIGAFGCVLYEMLTGRRAFEGEDVSDTLAAVLRGEPDWSLLPASVSPTSRLYLQCCLARDPNQRVHDIGDMRLALEGAFDVPVAPPLPAAPPSSSRGKRKMAIAMITIATVATVVGGIGARLLSPVMPGAVVRLIAPPPRGASTTPSQSDADVAISPDGSRVAFENVEQGSLRLYVRGLDQLDAVRLEVGGSPRWPFFSPDGEWIGFFDAGVLKRVSVNGGSPVVISAIKGTGVGATWGADGTIVFATSDSTGLMRVSVNGGEPSVLTKPGPGEDHILPQFLPGGRDTLFTVRPQANPTSGSQIALVNIESGAVSMLLPGVTYATYSSSGHLVYAAEGALRAVKFDLDTLSIRSNPVPVLDHVITKPLGAANFALASNGTLVYEAGDPRTSADRTLVWVNREGREEAIAAPRRSYVYPRISPDGKRVGLDIRDQQNDIWIWDFARLTLSRLTFDPGLNRAIAWTPDSRRVVFSAEREGSESLFSQPADGSGSPEQLTNTTPDRPQGPLSISPDGKSLVFGEPGQPPFDLNVLDLDGAREVTPLLNAPYSEHNGEISPDGRWLVYQTDESGRDEIYVRPFPNVAASRSQVSTGGGTRPMWSRNGREIFYSALDGTMMAVPVDSSAARDTFSAGTATSLFSGPYYSVQAGRSYDVATDGRFLMIKNNAPQALAPQLVVVINWVEELKRLVP
jgi:eukaryotic-like serine/threonine-protein kinase